MDIRAIGIEALGEFMLMGIPCAEVRKEREQALYAIHSTLQKGWEAFLVGSVKKQFKKPQKLESDTSNFSVKMRVELWL